jgi:RNA polymerase sigma factor (sigma-70 family)
VIFGAQHHPELLGEVDRVQHRQRRPLPYVGTAHPLRLGQQLLESERQAIVRLGDAVRHGLDATRARMAWSSPRDSSSGGLPRPGARGPSASARRRPQRTGPPEYLWPARCNCRRTSRHRRGVQISGEGFEELLRPHVEVALRLALAMLRSHADAEDAVQESATQAWRKIRQLREPSSFRPWFLAIVANRCRASRRSSWWSVLPLDPGLPNGEDSRPDDVVGRLDLRSALRRLGSDDRAALLLFYALDLPVDEVAAALGVSASAAKARIHRAAARLRTTMGEEVPR